LASNTRPARHAGTPASSETQSTTVRGSSANARTVRKSPAIRGCRSANQQTPATRTAPTQRRHLRSAGLSGVRRISRSNGEVEGPRRSVRLEPRAQTVFPCPRRHYRPSRFPPPIVRGQQSAMLTTHASPREPTEFLITPSRRLDVPSQRSYAAYRPERGLVRRHQSR